MAIKSVSIRIEEEMLEKIAALSSEFEFEQVVPISALQNDGIDILVSVLEGYAKPGPHYFADDSLTDQPERAIVAELIREHMAYRHRPMY